MTKAVIAAVVVVLAGCGGDARPGADPSPRAPALTADYGATGFQATAVRFPTAGCWKVVGSVGDARLTFVVRVTALRG